MNCNEYQGLISCLIDGELSPAEQSKLSRHISECESCRALYSAFSGVSALIADDLAEIPAGLNDNIMAAVRRESFKTVKPAKKQTGRIIAMCASIAALAAIALTLPSLRSPAHSASPVMYNAAPVYTESREASDITALSGSMPAGGPSSAESVISPASEVILADSAAQLDAEFNTEDFSEVIYAEAVSEPDTEAYSEDQPVFGFFSAKAVPEAAVSEDELSAPMMAAAMPEAASPARSYYDYYITDSALAGQISALFPAGGAAAELPADDQTGSFTIGFENGLPPVTVYICGEELYYSVSGSAFMLFAADPSQLWSLLA